MSSSFTAEPVNGASGTLPRDSGNSIIELRLELRGTVAKRTPSNGCYFRGTRGEAQMKEKRARKGLRKALVAGGIVLAVLLVLMAIGLGCGGGQKLSLIHISEPTRLGMISYAVFCLKKKKNYYL